MSNIPKRGPQLQPEHIAALKAFAAENGPGWKGALRYCWETGRYGRDDDAQALQSVRNVFGPKWLTRFNLTSIQ